MRVSSTVFTESVRTGDVEFHMQGHVLAGLAVSMLGPRYC